MESGMLAILLTSISVIADTWLSTEQIDFLVVWWRIHPSSRLWSLAVSSSPSSSSHYTEALRCQSPGPQHAALLCRDKSELDKVAQWQISSNMKESYTDSFDPSVCGSNQCRPLEDCVQLRTASLWVKVLYWSTQKMPLTHQRKTIITWPFINIYRIPPTLSSSC